MQKLIEGGLSFMSNVSARIAQTESASGAFWQLILLSFETLFLRYPRLLARSWLEKSMHWYIGRSKVAVALVCENNS